MHGVILDFRTPGYVNIPVYQEFPETNAQFVESIMFNASCGFYLDKIG